MSVQRREFPALLRRKRYLEQELYTYDKYLRNPESNMTGQAGMAINADQQQEELDEIDFLLRLFERLTNGFHLSRGQWLLMVLVVLVALALGIVAVMR